MQLIDPSGHNTPDLDHLQLDIMLDAEKNRNRVERDAMYRTSLLTQLKLQECQNVLL